jgi:ATP-binding cassette subfamily B protein
LALIVNGTKRAQERSADLSRNLTEVLHSEALIENALDRLLPGRTTLIIAHRLSTIRRATKILYIENGQVRETGTHADLIAAGGPYASLHAAQFAR